VPNDHDRRYLPALQDAAELLDKLPVVNLAKSRRILAQLGNGFRKLGARPVKIAAIEVVKADGRLNQTLVKEPERPFRGPPQVLPALVSLKIAPGIEKIYSVTQKVCHANNLHKLLKNIVGRGPNTLW
jgi:hypothetical protein